MTDITVEILRQIRADIAALASQVVSVDGRVTALEGRVTAMDGKMDVFGGRLDAQDQRLAVVDRRLEVLDTRMASVEGTLRVHGAALDGLAAGQQEIRETVGEIAVLLRQVAEDHEQRIGTIEARLD